MLSAQQQILLLALRRAFSALGAKQPWYYSGCSAHRCFHRRFAGTTSVGRHTACKAVHTFGHTTSHTACAVSRFSCAERHTRPRRLAARPPLGHTPALSRGDASCQLSLSR